MTGIKGDEIGIRKRHIAQGIVLTSIVLILPALLLEFAWLYGLAPLPAFYLATLLGRKAGTIAITVAIVLSGVVTGIAGGLPNMLFGLGLLPAGFVLAYSVKRGDTPHIAGLKASLVILLIWATGWLGLAMNQGVNPYQESIKSLDQNMVTWYEIYTKSAQPQTGDTKEIETAVIELRNLIPKVFPALMLMSVCMTVWLNMMAGQWLNKTVSGHSPWPHYREWKLPEHLVWGVVVCVAGLILPNERVQTFALNLLLVLGTLFFFQGMAVLSHLLERWKFPSLLRVIIFILICVQVFGIFFLSILGLLDTWFDMRQMRPKENEDIDQTSF